MIEKNRKGRGLGRLLLPVAMAVMGLAGGAVRADPVEIASSPTSLTSKADRMISYRFQEHMVQTADGATHVFINRGNYAGNAITLYSTFDGGATWVATGMELPSSGPASTSDMALDGNNLMVTYSGKASDIRFARFSYDPVLKSWTAGQTETVYASSAALAVTPALAADSLGRIWLAFTNSDKATGNYSIKMMVKDAGASGWADTGLVFGTVDNVSDERSGRPIVTSRGIGLVYTVHLDTYWSERLDRWALNARWPKALIYTKVNPTTDDPYGSHFSVVADAQQNLHMTQVDNGQLVYSRYLVSEKAWTSKFITTNGAMQAAYSQVLVSGNSVLAITNQLTELTVLRSDDVGTTFTPAYQLTHPAATTTISYNRPRMEAPAHPVGATVPLLQQYVDADVQKALYFAIPASTTP